MFFIIALIISSFIFGIAVLMVVASAYEYDSGAEVVFAIIILLLTGLWVFYNAWKIAGMIA